VTVQDEVRQHGWVRDDGDLAEIQKIVDSVGGARIEVLEHTEGILPVIGIAFIIFGTAAAIAAVDRIWQEHKGGHFVDMRGKSPAFGRDKNIPYGVMYIYKTDGTLEIKASPGQDSLDKVIEALQGIITDVAKAGIDAAKATVQGAVGSDATVEEKPAATPTPAAK
jgi:hypothetical protein